MILTVQNTNYSHPRIVPKNVFCLQYRLKFIISNRHSRAEVLHNSGVVVASASTVEFEITRHLYKTTDISAARNLGRVLAQRCQEAGITRVYWEPQYGDRKKLRVTRVTIKTASKSGKTAVRNFNWGWLNSSCDLK